MHYGARWCSAMNRLRCKCGAVLDETEGMTLTIPATHRQPNGTWCSVACVYGEVTIDHSGEYMLSVKWLARLSASHVTHHEGAGNQSAM